MVQYTGKRGFLGRNESLTIYLDVFLMYFRLFLIHLASSLLDFHIGMELC